MAAKHSHHVALTEAHAQYVAGQGAQGHYASASEVVRAGLRLLIERDKGLAEGASQPLKERARASA